MEMCYDEALVMPSSYAVMDEDEMTYVEGGKVYKASKALSYLSRQVALCTIDTVGGLVVAGVGAPTIILCIVGSAISAFMGQWASAYATAWTTINRKCKQYGSTNWLVGVDEDLCWGLLTVTIW